MGVTPQSAFLIQIKTFFQVREKIGNALKDMPEHPEIRELLSGSNINFFNCVKIVEILKETEKDSKNFFGQYGSQRMTDWKEVLHLYESENIYLAEASQLLIQAVVYELPGLKKQITKVSQIQRQKIELNLFPITFKI